MTEPAASAASDKPAAPDKSFLGTQPLGPLMRRLALPAIASQLVALLYNVVDRAFVGHIPDIGVQALTGLGVVLPLLAVIQSFGSYLGAGCAPLAGMRLGARDMRGVQVAVGNAATLLVLVTVVELALCLLFGGPLLSAFGASPDTLPFAQLYLNIYLIGLPFILATHVFSMLLLGQGGSKEVLKANVTSSLLNVALDALFIMGFGWGIAGAASATVIAELVCVTMLGLRLQRPDSAFRIRPDALKLQVETVRRIFSIGIGRFFVNSTEGVLVIVLNAQMQRFGGDAWVASLTILETLQMMCFGVSSGFTQGTQGILSYCYGAKLAQRTKDTMKRLVATGFAINAATTLLLMLFASPVISLFTSDPDTIERTAQMVPLFLSGMTLFGIQLGIQTIFMSTGHGFCSLIVAAVRKIVLFIPLAFILPPFQGAFGVVLAEPISDFLSIAFCSCFFAIMYRKIRLQ